MTRDESLTIVSMLLSHWHSSKEWTREEMDVYARLIQDLDVELTMAALIRAAKEIPYRPSVADLRERVRLEKQRLAPTMVATKHKSQPMPLWVKRWICARMLYETFGRERDMRRFPEQEEFGDQTTALMPENEWLKEANSRTEKEFANAFQRMTR